MPVCQFSFSLLTLNLCIWSPKPENGQTPRRVMGQFVDTFEHSLKTTPIIKTKIVHFYVEKGLSLGSISKRLRVSKDFARKVLKGAGVKLRKVGGAFDLPANPPYGWKKENGKLVPHHSEQEVIRKMGALRVDGETLRGIARDLNEAKIPPKKGGKWHSYTIGKILKENPFRIQKLGNANPFKERS